MKTRYSALVSVAIIVVLLVTSCKASKGSFSLINNTKEPIARALVTICGQTIELRNIGPSKSAARTYDVKFDSHYAVEVVFLSGKKLRKETGYVTNGMKFQHEIVVTDSDIEITESKISLND